MPRAQQNLVMRVLMAQDLLQDTYSTLLRCRLVSAAKYQAECRLLTSAQQRKPVSTNHLLGREWRCRLAARQWSAKPLHIMAEQATAAPACLLLLLWLGLRPCDMQTAFTAH